MQKPSIKKYLKQRELSNKISKNKIKNNKQEIDSNNEKRKSLQIEKPKQILSQKSSKISLFQKPSNNQFENIYQQSQPQINQFENKELQQVNSNYIDFKQSTPKQNQQNKNKININPPNKKRIRTKEKNYNKRQQQQYFDIYEEQSKQTDEKEKTLPKKLLTPIIKTPQANSVKSFMRPERRSLANLSLQHKLEKKKQDISLRQEDIKSQLGEEIKMNNKEINEKIEQLKRQKVKQQKQYKRFLNNDGLKCLNKTFNNNIQKQNHSFNGTYYVKEIKKILLKYSNEQQLTSENQRILNSIKDNFNKIQLMKKLGVKNVEEVLPFKIDMSFIKHNIQYKRYLILDLDETLIYTTGKKINQNSFQLKGKQKGYVSLRPYVKQFLQEMFQYFNLILYTAGESNYAEQILKILDPQNKLFIIKLYRQNCVYIQNGIYLKLMSFLHNLNYDQTIFVDNSPYHLYENLQQGLPIIPFNGDNQDNELIKLSSFLRTIYSIKNYTKILQKNFNLSLYKTENEFQNFIIKLLSTQLIQTKLINYFFYENQIFILIINMNFTQFANLDPKLKKLVMLWNMADELSEEPPLEYAIKLYLLFQVNTINKRLKNPQLEQFCRQLISDLESKKQIIGQINNHHKSVEKIVVSEYKALISDFDNQQTNSELIEGFIKIGKLFDVLTVFNVDQQTKQNYEKLSKNSQKYALKVKQLIQNSNKQQPQTINQQKSMISKIRLSKQDYQENGFQLPQQNNQTQQYQQNNQPQSYISQTQQNQQQYQGSYIPSQYTIQDQRYNNYLPLNLTQNSRINESFDQQINLNGIFNEISIQIEAHDSFIKKKFKDNLHKVTSFQTMKQKMNQAKHQVENENLKNCYQVLLTSYNDLSENCKEEAKYYERCKKGPSTSTPIFECEKQTKNIYDCLRKQMKIEPLCLQQYNNAKECLFKLDKSQLGCKKYSMLFKDCQIDPNGFINFLKASTVQQKQDLILDFDRYPGTYPNI